MRFVAPFIDVILMVLTFIEYIVIGWVILSWIMFFASQSSFRWRYRGFYGILAQINDLLSRMTYPFMRPFRRILPPHKMGGIDWSPLLLLLAIYILRGVVSYLYAAFVFRA